MTQNTRSRGLYALAGVLASAAGVAVSVGAALALRADTNPVLAVAAVVRDHTPGPLAAWLIARVGHADKPLLVSGTVVILLLLGAGIGVLGIRRPVLADVGLLVLVGIGLLAVLTQAHTGIAEVAGVLLGLIAWLIALRVLTGQLEREDVAHPESPDRRGFLAAGGAVVVVGALAALGGRMLSSGSREVERARALLRLPLSAGRVPSDANVGVSGIAPWRTPNSGFYLINTELVPPDVTPSQWKLRIHGMVDREINLTYQQLIERQLTGAWVTLCCVSNEVGGDLISNAYFEGVPVHLLLAEAGVQPGADAIKQTSYDGWTCGTPIAAVTDPKRNALLAVGMNGVPLPIEHGFPVRMVVPGLYGYVSATKWLVDIEVTRFADFQAYWTQEGWSPQGPVKTESRIDVPSGGQVPAGALAVGGVAWAQHTGIEKVEFQLDGGPWQTARLGGVPDLDTWVQWSGQVHVAAGSHQLRVRATDRSGYTQTAAIADVVPNGATGWDSVAFTAV